MDQKRETPNELLATLRDAVKKILTEQAAQKTMRECHYGMSCGGLGKPK